MRCEAALGGRFSNYAQALTRSFVAVLSGLVGVMLLSGVACSEPTHSATGDTSAPGSSTGSMTSRPPSPRDDRPYPPPAPPMDTKVLDAIKLPESNSDLMIFDEPILEIHDGAVRAGKPIWHYEPPKADKPEVGKDNLIAALDAEVSRIKAEDARRPISMFMGGINIAAETVAPAEYLRDVVAACVETGFTSPRLVARAAGSAAEPRYVALPVDVKTDDRMPRDGIDLELTVHPDSYTITVLRVAKDYSTDKLVRTELERLEVTRSGRADVALTELSTHAVRLKRLPDLVDKSTFYLRAAVGVSVGDLVAALDAVRRDGDGRLLFGEPMLVR